MNKHQKLLDFLPLAAIILLPLALGPRMLGLYVPFLLFLPIACLVAFVHKRRKEQPTRWMWLARACCVMPLIGVVGITVVSVFHGLSTGVEPGIKTALYGYIALTALYGILFVLAPKFPQYMIKEAGWEHQT